MALRSGLARNLQLNDSLRRIFHDYKEPFQHSLQPFRTDEDFISYYRTKNDTITLVKYFNQQFEYLVETRGTRIVIRSDNFTNGSLIMYLTNSGLLRAEVDLSKKLGIRLIATNGISLIDYLNQNENLEPEEFNNGSIVIRRMFRPSKWFKLVLAVIKTVKYYQRYFDGQIGLTSIENIRLKWSNGNMSVHFINFDQARINYPHQGRIYDFGVQNQVNVSLVFNDNTLAPYKRFRVREESYQQPPSDWDFIVAMTSILSSPSVWNCWSSLDKAQSDSILENSLSKYHLDIFKRRLESNSRRYRSTDYEETIKTLTGLRWLQSPLPAFNSVYRDSS